MKSETWRKKQSYGRQELIIRRLEKVFWATHAYLKVRFKYTWIIIIVQT